MTLIEKWDALVALCGDKGLGDGAYTVSPGLRWARPIDAPGGARMPSLPEDFQRFIDAAGGYPVFGLQYYDREGWSFLPPSACEALSVLTPDTEGEWPDPGDDGIANCSVVFFAGMEMSDHDGWSFGPDPDDPEGELVWETSGMPRDPVGRFATWFEERLDQALARVGNGLERLSRGAR